MGTFSVPEVSHCESEETLDIFQFLVIYRTIDHKRP